MRRSTDIFRRDSENPILVPSNAWWEAKGVLNPAAARLGSSIVLVYRAVGSDGVSRFGLASSRDGRHFERRPVPLYEAGTGDWAGRLGVEDPRITALNSRYYVTYTKVSVEPADQPKPAWETAPFRLRSWIGQSDDFGSIKEIGPVLVDRTTKDMVLFPERIHGRYLALTREYPSIQLVTSENLRAWRQRATILDPIPGGWEAERVGAGPPPVRISTGWLLLYHANQYLRRPGNQRMYRMGLALLDGADPCRVLYRHPEPILEPSARYECEGPVGNVVFGTGLIDDGERFHLYYGAADGVVGLATVEKQGLFALLPDHLRP